ncbi:MAG: phage tail tape measure protein [Coriobacteriia bacterium]|nr:phage tail tape measure protein [Coriobacteriia bacterium]
MDTDYGIGISLKTEAKESGDLASAIGTLAEQIEKLEKVLNEDRISSGLQSQTKQVDKLASSINNIGTQYGNINNLYSRSFQPMWSEDADAVDKYNKNLMNAVVNMNRAESARARFYQIKLDEKPARDLELAYRNLYYTIRNDIQAAQQFANTMKRVGESLISVPRESVRGFAAIQDQLQMVRRTTLEVGENAERMNQGLLRVVTSTAAGIKNIAMIAEIGGQAGVAAREIESYTRAAAIFADSTEVSAEQAGLAIARIQNLTSRANPGQTYEMLANAMFVVANASAATTQEITNITTRLAPLASQFGLATSEILGTGAALTSFGVEAQAGATSMMRSFALISRAVGESGDRLELMGRISGLGAERFAQAWNDKPVEAFALLLEGMNKAEYGGNQFMTTMAQLGFNATRDGRTWLALASNIGEWQRQMDLAASAMVEDGEMAARYTERMQTIEQQLIRINENYQVLQYTMLKGLPYEPVKFMADMLGELSTYLDRNPGIAFFAGLTQGALAAVGAIAKGVGAFSQFAANIGMATMASLQYSEMNARMQGVSLKSILINMKQSESIKEMIFSIFGYDKMLEKVTGSIAAQTAVTTAKSTVTKSLTKDVAGLSAAERVLERATGATTNKMLIQAATSEVLSKGMKKAGKDVAGQAAEAAKAISEEVDVIADMAKVAGVGSVSLKDLAGALGLTGANLGALVAGAGALALVGISIKAINDAMVKYQQRTETYEQTLDRIGARTGNYSLEISQSARELENLSRSGRETNVVLVDITNSVGSVSRELRQAAGDMRGLMVDIETFTGSLQRSEFFDRMRDVQFDTGWFNKGSLYDLVDGTNGAMDAINALYDELAKTGDVDKFLKSTGEIIQALVNLESAFDIERNTGYTEDIESIIEQNQAILRGYGIQATSDSVLGLRSAFTMLNVEGRAYAENLVRQAAESRNFSDEIDDIAQSVTILSAELEFLNSVMEDEKALSDLAKEFSTWNDQLSETYNYAMDAAAALEYIDLMATKYGIGSEQHLQATIDTLYLLEQAGLKGTTAWVLAWEEYENAALRANEQTNELINTIGFVPTADFNALPWAEKLQYLQAETLKWIAMQRQAGIDAANANYASASKNLPAFLQPALEAKRQYEIDAAQNMYRELFDLANTLQAEPPALNASTAALDANTKARNSNAGGAGGQAKALRTVLDYAKDLNTVLKTMNDLHRGVYDAQIDVAKAYEAIALQAYKWELGLREVDNLTSDILKAYFGRMNAEDSIAGEFAKLQSEIEKAKEKWDDLQRSLSEQRGEEAQLRYWLSIAEAVGDVAEQQKLQARLQANLAKQQSTKKEMVSPEFTVTGDTDAARSGRKDIQDLLKTYMEYIVTLAETGATQEELESETLRLRKEFVSQAESLGLTAEETEYYAKALDAQIVMLNHASNYQDKQNSLLEKAADAEQRLIIELIKHGASQAEVNAAIAEGTARLGSAALSLGNAAKQADYYTYSLQGMKTILDNLPRNINIDIRANIDPAKAALAQFEKDAQKSGAGAAGGFASGFVGGANWTKMGNDVADKLTDAIRAKLNNLQLKFQLVESNGHLGGGGKFMSGGYTGNIPASQIAGVVHGREWVVPADMTAKYGLEFLDAINKGTYSPTAYISQGLSEREIRLIVADTVASMPTPIISLKDATIAQGMSSAQVRYTRGALV